MTTHLFLGIESSCDETAVAIVSSDRAILAHQIYSQTKVHQPYGGVVPELGARAHAEHIYGLTRTTLQEADITLEDLTGVAATCGPGLIGGILVGATFAKALCYSKQLPFYAINHLAGHALTPRLTDNVAFPYLLLLASGGHCQILVVHSAVTYELLGQTLDDAAGEAFDKVAKVLNLGYPGGPAVEALAQQGDENAFALPVPLLNRPEHACNFSFSGLKTAVIQRIGKNTQWSLNQKADLCASFQATVARTLANRCANALNYLQANNIPITAFVVAGGVVANAYLRKTLHNLAHNYNLSFVAPEARLCTDNAAMIAWAGVEKWRLGKHDKLDFRARPRWPLETLGKEH